jgi:hypothetical protein
MSTSAVAAGAGWTRTPLGNRLDLTAKLAALRPVLDG